MKKAKIFGLFGTVGILIPAMASCSAPQGETFTQIYKDDEENISLSNAINIEADFSTNDEPALVKKIQMYNAGCIQPVENYARDMELAKGLNPESLRIDLSLGKSNGQGGLDLVTGDYDFYDYDETTGKYKVDKNSLNFNFSTFDHSMSYFKEMGVLPYISWCYIPLPLAYNGEFRNLDNDIENWQEVWEECYYNYAKHCLDTGLQVGYHEMYNEPDLEMLKLWGIFDEDDDYFLDINDFAPNGDPSQGCYYDMYKYGIQGILRADPDATVGGPAFALGELGVQDWVNFLPRVKQERLQMDFYSFHSYLDGNTWYMSESDRNKGKKNELETIVDGLQSDTLFLTTDVHINEYTPLSNDNGALSGINAPFNYYIGGSNALDAIFEVVDRTEVNMVSWAQLLSVNNSANDPYGIISPDGYEKSMYNAIRMYQDMPVWRYKSTASKNDGIRSVVSSSDDKISILLWNTNENKNAEGDIVTDGDRTVNVTVKDAKFDYGNRKIYRIDKDHASYFDQTLTTGLSAQNLKHVELKDYESVWKGNVPAKGVVYITIDKTEDKENFNYHSDFVYEPDSNFANDIKVQYWHEDRYRDLKGNREEYVDFRDNITGTYSHVDRKTWTAYLGMGSLEGRADGKYKGQGVANTAITCNNLPTEFDILVDMNSRLYHSDIYSSFGARIDFYDDAKGKYTDSVYFHNGIYNPAANPNDQDARLFNLTPYPWGTKTYADKNVKFDNGNWHINLNDYAPEGWLNGSRKAIISFDMRNCGADARASFKLVK